MSELWITICHECMPPIRGKEDHCPRCGGNSVRQHDIGYLFPEHLARFGMSIPPGTCEDPPAVEESPEQTRIKEYERGGK
jgi:hypothetical protein